jgi:hypothetical protein
MLPSSPTVWAIAAVIVVCAICILILLWWVWRPKDEYSPFAGNFLPEPDDYTIPPAVSSVLWMDYDAVKWPLPSLWRP